MGFKEELRRMQQELRQQQAQQAEQARINVQRDAEAERQAMERRMQGETERKKRIDELGTKVSERWASLGVEEMLQGIKEEAWGNEGRIESIAETDHYDLHYNSHLVISKGARLIYDYEEPIKSLEFVTVRKFGIRRWSFGSSMDSWGNEIGAMSGTDFPFYKEYGYNVKYKMYKRSIAIGVVVEGKDYDEESKPEDFRVLFVDPNGYGLRVGGSMAFDPKTSKALIEDAFLQNCLDRQRNNILPKDLFSKSQSELSRIKQEVRQNPHI